MNQNEEPWLLPFLSIIRRRPGIFGLTSCRDLRNYIEGYCDARASLGHTKFGRDDQGTLEAFERWLGARRGHSANTTIGWDTMIRLFDPSDHNLNAFFSEFSLFLADSNRPALGEYRMASKPPDGSEEVIWQRPEFLEWAGIHPLAKRD